MVRQTQMNRAVAEEARVRLHNYGAWFRTVNGATHVITSNDPLFLQDLIRHYPYNSSTPDQHDTVREYNIVPANK